MEKRPERAIDQQIKEFKDYKKKSIWTQEEKIELDTDHDDSEEKVQNNDVLVNDMKHYFIDNELKEYINSEFKIIGFDESSHIRSGTYALLMSCKFGECQIKFSNGKYEKEKIMYRPISGYIEDNEHKLIIYRDVIKAFVDTIKSKFYFGSLKEKVDKLEEWFELKFKKNIEEQIKIHDFNYPIIGHIVDRIRTADEILKSLIRIKEESNCGKNKKVIFLGDGIQMFRQHIFPVTAFIDLFYEFIHKYGIKFYSFSKTCRLRDAQGNFILPIWSEILEKKMFMVEIPYLSKYTRSKAHIVRLQNESSALRFDVPDYCTHDDAMTILKNLIPYSPLGYPLCLTGAHEASTLLTIEYNKLEARFMELNFDPQTKKYAQSWREKVLPH